MKSSHIGVYGLGVMGRNFARNLEEKDFSMCVFNRKAPGEETVVQDFINESVDHHRFYGAGSKEDFFQFLEKPRNILLMEITSKIFRVVDADGDPLIDPILDCAAQKGTGRWTTIEGLENH